MLRFVQHDRPMSFRTLSFVIPNASEESTHGCFTSLRSVQHDMLCHSECFFPVIPNVFSLLFRVLFSVIPSASEESSAMWMLRFAQHGWVRDGNLLSLSLQKERDVCPRQTG
jgi:hypothetical protein